MTSAAQRESHPRRLAALLAKGWQQLGSRTFLSPYTGCRYNEQAAFDIEILRGHGRFGLAGFRGVCVFGSREKSGKSCLGKILSL